MWAVRRALCGQFAASDGVMAGEVRKEAVASGKLEVKVAFHDRPCELCSMKVDAEKGGTFWGGTKDVTKLVTPPLKKEVSCKHA